MDAIYAMLLSNRVFSVLISLYILYMHELNLCASSAHDCTAVQCTRTKMLYDITRST